MDLCVRFCEEVTVFIGYTGILIVLVFAVISIISYIMGENDWR